MYVHIGGDYSIPSKTIIGIFSFDDVTAEGSYTNEFLKRAQDNNIVEIIDFELPKSFVIAVDRVYISPVSARTIAKRINNN